MSILSDRLQLPDVANLSDWEASEVLNTPDPELPFTWVPAPCEVLRRIIMERGEWAAIKRASTAANQQIADAAITVYDVLTLQDAVHLEMPTVRTTVEITLNALQTANIISSATAALLVDAGKRTLSWAEANNIEVTARTVGIARGSIE
jgi:hypothetical protein